MSGPPSVARHTDNAAGATSPVGTGTTQQLRRPAVSAAPARAGGRSVTSTLTGTPSSTASHQGPSSSDREAAGTPSPSAAAKAAPSKPGWTAAPSAGSGPATE